ncbi:MAG TPA: hypothetical protein VIB38_10035 [Aestuariivirgaceae bacterium]|jgi:hypothetical protein
MPQLRPLIRYLASALSLYIVLTIATPGASAKEVPVVAALCDAIEGQIGVRPAYRRVKKAKDGTITIRGLTTEVKESKAADRKLDGTLSVEKVTLSGITQTAGGLFEVTEATFSNVIFMGDGEEETGSALRLPEVKIERLLLGPGSTPAATSAWILPVPVQAQSFTTSKGMLSSGGVSLEIGSISATFSRDSESGVGRTDLRVEDVHYPASAIRRSDPTGVVLSLFGGGDLVFDLAGTAMLGPEGGVFETALTVRSLGVVQMTGTLAGRSPSVLASAAAASQSDVDIPAPAASPLMLSSISVRYEDLSLTGKLLALLAEDLGLSREELIRNATAAVEASLGAANENLPAQLAEAIAAYLAEPRSFTISTQPEQPVPIEVFINNAAEGPAGLLARYPASIAVND